MSVQADEIRQWISKALKHNIMEKKITRGIKKEFADAFKNCDLYPLYEQHKDELFIGVRNNYLNLYYNCDSIAKVTYTRGKIHCEINRYYLKGVLDDSIENKGTQKVTPDYIVKNYDTIKSNSNKRTNDERKAQSKLVLMNNANRESNWFCIDVEYIKQYKNIIERDEANLNGRFDIIALSKSKPHKVALIELKYGTKSIGGESGIFKHVGDFVKFKEKGFFESHLKGEIIEIIKSQVDIGIQVPFQLPTEIDFLLPEFYFITLNNNPEKVNGSTPKQMMGARLFKDKKKWNSKKKSTKECVEDSFGDITKKENSFHATFLFSKATLENLNITDIIDGSYDEKIIPA